jgi:hypothetical protein
LRRQSIVAAVGLIGIAVAGAVVVVRRALVANAIAPA